MDSTFSSYCNFCQYLCSHINIFHTMYHCYDPNKNLNFTYKEKKCQLGLVVQTYNPSYLGIASLRLTWSTLEFKANSVNLARPSQNKNIKWGQDIAQCMITIHRSSVQSPVSHAPDVNHSTFYSSYLYRNYICFWIPLLY